MKFSKKQIDALIQMCLENGITSTQLGDGTLIKQSTAHRILNKETQAPSTTSLIQIRDFLIKRFPDRFDVNGDVVVDNPLELNKDYQKAINLLTSPSFSEGDKEELAKLIEGLAVKNETLSREIKRLKEACKTLVSIYNDL